MSVVFCMLCDEATNVGDEDLTSTASLLHAHASSHAATVAPLETAATSAVWSSAFVASTAATWCAGGEAWLSLTVL